MIIKDRDGKDVLEVKMVVGGCSIEPIVNTKFILDYVSAMKLVEEIEDCF